MEKRLIYRSTYLFFSLCDYYLRMKGSFSAARNFSFRISKKDTLDNVVTTENQTYLNK